MSHSINVKERSRGLSRRQRRLVRLSDPPGMAGLEGIPGTVPWTLPDSNPLNLRRARRDCAPHPWGAPPAGARLRRSKIAPGDFVEHRLSGQGFESFRTAAGK